MSCDACAANAKDPGRGQFFYRWGAANVEIVACPEHVREIMGALNVAQAQGRSRLSAESGLGSLRITVLLIDQPTLVVDTATSPMTDDEAWRLAWRALEHLRPERHANIALRIWRRGVGEWTLEGTFRDSHPRTVG